jgi:hypothetical protein
MSKSIQLMSVATLLATTLCTSQLSASSHREAPAITQSPKVDATDFYMFNSYEKGREGYTTILANYIPLQDPQGGPNYFAMDENAVYDIHIDNNADSVEDLTFRFRFKNELVNNGEGITLNIDGKDIAIPLKHAGAIIEGDSSALGFNESYSLTLIEGDRKTGSKNVIAESLKKPYDNVGKKTFPDYKKYADAYIHEVTIPNCNEKAKVFVGQRKESFAVNLGETFDLVNYVPVDRSFAPFATAGIEQLESNNDLQHKNITTLALEIPTKCLVKDDKNPIIGAWTTASMPQARILRPNGQFAKNSLHGGALTQVSRLSNPLVNELVIGLKDKNLFNTSEPKDDTQFINYVTNPTLPALLNILFLDAVNSVTGATFSNLAPTNFPRNDLVSAFLTGFTEVNKNGSVGEMLRLNTAIKATEFSKQNSLGLVTGDLAGYPNGRRVGDDVVDIALRVVMGTLCHPVNIDLDANGVVGDKGDNLGLCKPEDAVTGQVPFTDGAPISDASFDSTFPYLKTPLAGSPN